MVEISKFSEAKGVEHLTHFHPQLQIENQDILAQNLDFQLNLSGSTLPLD